MRNMKKLKEIVEKDTTQTAAGDASPEHGAELANTNEIADLKVENEKLKHQIRMDAAHNEMTRRLAEAGAWSPGLMFGAVTGELQFDDEGKLLNGAAVVEKLKRDFPESFVSGARPGTIDGGAGAVQRKGLTKEALSKMSPEEIRRLDWEDVRRTLSER
jgi:hypothetical protein